MAKPKTRTYKFDLKGRVAVTDPSNPFPSSTFLRLEDNSYGYTSKVRFGKRSGWNTSTAYIRLRVTNEGDFVTYDFKVDQVSLAEAKRLKTYLERYDHKITNTWCNATFDWDKLKTSDPKVTIHGWYRRPAGANLLDFFAKEDAAEEKRKADAKEAAKKRRRELDKRRREEKKRKEQLSQDREINDIATALKILKRNGLKVVTVDEER